MTLWELTDKKTIENYNALVDSIENGATFEMESKEELARIVDEIMGCDSDFIMPVYINVNKLNVELKLATALGEIIVNPNTNKMVNGFLLYMPTYGGACSKCRRDIICIHMPDGFKRIENTEMTIPVPFVEDIMVAMGRDLKEVEMKMTNGFGVLLESRDYDFYCPECKTWGKMVYEEETGLTIE